MKWIRASEKLPKENTFHIFRWLDTRDVFRKTLKSLRDENGNIGGLPLLEWLDESLSSAEEAIYDFVEWAYSRCERVESGKFKGKWFLKFQLGDDENADDVYYSTAELYNRYKQSKK